MCVCVCVGGGGMKKVVEESFKRGRCVQMREWELLLSLDQWGFVHSQWADPTVVWQTVSVQLSFSASGRENITHGPHHRLKLNLHHFSKLFVLLAMLSWQTSNTAPNGLWEYCNSRQAFIPATITCFYQIPPKNGVGGWGVVMHILKNNTEIKLSPVKA